MNFSLIILIFSFILFNVSVFVYLQKLFDNNSTGKIKGLLCLGLNISVLFALIYNSFSLILLFSITIFLFIAELFFIFKIHIRQALFIYSSIFMHIFSIFLFMLILFVLFTDISPIILHTTNQYYLFLSFFFCTITAMIFLMKKYLITKIRKIYNEPFFSEMMSVICIFIIFYTLFDSCILLSNEINIGSVIIATTLILLNFSIFYQLLFFTIKFASISFCSKQSTDLSRCLKLLLLKETELTHKNQTDNLTELYNRSFIFPLIDSLCNNFNRPFVVVFIDINGLKKINDSLGHNIGDEYIKHIANASKTTFNKNDYIARIGGDEILIICENLEESKISDTIKKFEENIILRNTIDNNFKMSASIGYIFVTKEIAKKGSNFVVEQADLLMRANKKRFYESGNN